ncbi:L,D-transpeptidase [Phyllobacterium myrsinacearum]|uniref:L,D-transpeptidase n=1 Tax=Phyllobacterium myrsinacearum TaxID=28101 RepID=A0A2S9JQG6_9HYPH|nr:L,D-transpeptidase [Phyllobacterium myrsinacearum]PRD55434.1 L,D-transpeptidase [Phyllobacterium myrsinacearum]PWV91776.1 lipoprotein-anchoring transpeptidase ErfK/SrfK [Phyllobacterium myrsinacearum]RZV05845.1 lipoprotein-anchoring transpeptidase ErfK/SrfK [Phyllobacterium myrsinacearum]
MPSFKSFAVLVTLALPLVCQPSHAQAGQVAGGSPENADVIAPEYRDFLFGESAPVTARRPHHPTRLAAPKYVAYTGNEAAGTIVIDTHRMSLSLVLGGSALVYPIGVGREGFAWHGVEQVSRKAKWPSWTPPADMLKRRPDLPASMPGGADNPLGSRAIYLGQTLYRIHGTNEPETIGTTSSSGCFRMLNSHVDDLYERVKIGAKVVVM